MERWLIIDAATDYEISDTGRVRRCVESKRKGRVCVGVEKRTYLSKKGYSYTSLMSNGKMKGFQVHRLVAKAFIGFSRLTVNHKNGIKHDNRVENLEYVTSKENSRHAYWDLDVGPHGEKHHNAKLTEASIAKIWELKDAGLNAYQIAPLIGCTRANICYILRGKAWARVSAKLGRITLPTT